MADYIYLLENRLSQAQQAALQAVREAAREKGVTVFLVGGAVRDLTAGSPVRDLDFTVQGNALKLKKDLQAAGGILVGESEHAIFLRFRGGVRVEVSSALSVTFPKPGKPVVKAANILDDLRRRDFTANAMALSLNEGSYGLLMDPTNGVADIENRQIRLVSNYGFIEDPVRMIRAVRFTARLGWMMEEKTQTRYETGKEEGYISAMSAFQRGYETEEIFHEEDPLRVLRTLEAEGWMKHLFPALTTAKVNVTELQKIRDIQGQLELRGIHPHAAASNFPLLTAKLSAKEVADLKKSFVRPGFVQEIEGLDAEAKEFATQLTSKTAALPSEAWKLIVSARPEAVLWAAYASKSGAVQSRFKSFYTEWPQARQRISYGLLQEMRIVPELPGYDELLEKLFFELMDGKLTTTEEMKTFLEPYSPPAPPPPVNLRRSRGRKEGKSKSRKKVATTLEEGETDESGLELPSELEENPPVDESGKPSLEEAVSVPAAKTPPAKKAVPPAKAKPVPPPAKAPAVKEQPVKAPAQAKKAAATATPVPGKTVAKAKPVPAPAKPKKVVPPPAKKTVPAKKAAPAKTVKAPAPAKKMAAPAKKTVAKAVQAPAKKVPVPAKKTVVKAPAKKAAPVKAVAKKTAVKAAPAAKRAVPAKKALKTAARKR